jgi:hypothetical protein
MRRIMPAPETPSFRPKRVIEILADQTATLCEKFYEKLRS